MDTLSNFTGKRDDLQMKILLATIVLIGLMVLFPPKATFNKNPILGVTQTQSAGYQFFFSDPSAEQKQAARVLMGDEVDKYIGSYIEWGKLLIQIVVVAGVAVAASRFLATPQSRRMGGSSS